MKYQYFSIYLIVPFLAYSYYFGYTPLLVSFIFVVASLLAYVIYAKDKSAARTGDWRVSENTLHLLALFCGWPGAIIAQQKLRHKTKKLSFQVFFWLTLLINIGVIAWIHTPEGSRILHSNIYKLEYFVASEFDSNLGITTLLLLTKFRLSI